MHSMRVLLDLLPELLVEFGSLSGSGGAAAGQSLGAGQPRRGDRRTARQSRGSVPALPLPYHHELLEGLPEGPQSGERDRRIEKVDGRPAGLASVNPGLFTGGGLSPRRGFTPAKS